MKDKRERNNENKIEDREVVETKKKILEFGLFSLLQIRS